jgi:hypothetical protein
MVKETWVFLYHVTLDKNEAGVAFRRMKDVQVDKQNWDVMGEMKGDPIYFTAKRVKRPVVGGVYEVPVAKDGTSASLSQMKFLGTLMTHRKEREEWEAIDATYKSAKALKLAEKKMSENPAILQSLRPLQMIYNRARSYEERAAIEVATLAMLRRLPDRLKGL